MKRINAHIYKTLWYNLNNQATDVEGIRALTPVFSSERHRTLTSTAVRVQTSIVQSDDVFYFTGDCQLFLGA